MIRASGRNFGGCAAYGNEPPNPLSSSVTGTDFVPPDPRIPLLNLSLLGQKLDSLRSFLSDSLNRNVTLGDDQLQLVSSEIASAVQQVIINGSALLASARLPDVVRTPHTLYQANEKPSDNSEQPLPTLPKVEVTDADAVIVEIDSAKLMAEHVHFCEICGKGFRRDANLRMHMRAHGDRFKSLESLTKPDGRIASGEVALRRPVRFSCPYLSCRRNRNHALFRPLKTAVCVRNHFRRSHCPKMYTCDLCNEKSFSVVADLKSHRKYCGEIQWRCSCGTSFSRKDKLFAHVTLFDGHTPLVGTAEEEKGKGLVIGGEIKYVGEGVAGGLDEEFFDGFMEEIGELGGGWMGLEHL